MPSKADRLAANVVNALSLSRDCDELADELLSHAFADDEMSASEHNALVDKAERLEAEAKQHRADANRFEAQLDAWER